MRVWLNHWFSTAYYFVDSIKKAGYTVIGTNKRDTCVYRENCDEFYIEPSLSGVAYVNWCIDFCASHDIDIFMPRYEMHSIISNLNEFKKLGVSVVCEENLDWFELLNNKYKTASYFKNNDICSVPEQALITSVEQFKESYKYFKDKYDSVCIKYNEDEGGQSYKRISDRKPKIERISENNGLVYSYDYIVECLSSVDSFKDILMMPYLEGTEISVDCLGVDNKLLAVPRHKLSNRVTRFMQSSDLYTIVKNFYDALPLVAPFNVQFRLSGGSLYFLEVNTRLSGGSWKARNLGIDFASLAVDKFAGKHIYLPSCDFESCTFSSLEGCVRL